jgi:hypothetical protein
VLVSWGALGWRHLVCLMVSVVLLGHDVFRLINPRV